MGRVLWLGIWLGFVSFCFMYFVRPYGSTVYRTIYKTVLDTNSQLTIIYLPSVSTLKTLRTRNGIRYTNIEGNYFLKI